MFAYLAYNVALPPFQGPDLPETEWESDVDSGERSNQFYRRPDIARELREAFREGASLWLTNLDDDAAFGLDFRVP